MLLSRMKLSNRTTLPSGIVVDRTPLFSLRLVNNAHLGSELPHRHRIHRCRSCQTLIVVAEDTPTETLVVVRIIGSSDLRPRMYNGRQ